MLIYLRSESHPKQCPEQDSYKAVEFAHCSVKMGGKGTERMKNQISKGEWILITLLFHCTLNREENYSTARSTGNLRRDKNCTQHMCRLSSYTIHLHTQGPLLESAQAAQSRWRASRSNPPQLLRVYAESLGGVQLL